VVKGDYRKECIYVFFLFSFCLHSSVFLLSLQKITTNRGQQLMDVLTRRQREIFNFLRDNYGSFAYPPSLDQLCAALGMASRGSLYKHIMALVAAGLVEPFAGKKKGGVRLTAQAQSDDAPAEQGLPFVGAIAAGKPIEALETISYMTVPDALKTDKP
jgi:repressor LexA